MKTNKGFTLIELLVVIAIIGVLASVVLASLSSARTKGNDAKIQSQLSAMRSQALLWNNTGTLSSYTLGTCNGTATNTLFETTNNGLGKLLPGTTTTGTGCYAAGALGGAWVVAWPLNSGGYFCVDSTGAARSTGPGGAYTSAIGTIGSAPSTPGAAITTSTGTSCN